MPIYLGRDEKGYYYQYGPTGAKYYFKHDLRGSEKIAYDRAARQGRAIQSVKNRMKV